MEREPAEPDFDSYIGARKGNFRTVWSFWGENPAMSIFSMRGAWARAQGPGARAHGPGLFLENHIWENHILVFLNLARGAVAHNEKH